ncbi:hypothetical protein DPMN_085490 [Dreissena polymorpha]|uniref:Uncharacterized protein n=1 Tax=Dreissena polymorpha TaxID=45954 RepID=A0A9D3YDU2_DREPO|nr:hypothetical protein DPMN_085490 [Dreissena polymorpha]
MTPHVQGRREQKTRTSADDTRKIPGGRGVGPLTTGCGSCDSVQMSPRDTRRLMRARACLL